MSDLPLTIIGGYLGTGKTTLINHLLRNADGMRLAILVNEFGSLSIDEDLIVQPAQPDSSEADKNGQENQNLISIAGGCVCCSYGNDLTLAMMDLLALDPRPDHVVLESSGVALPASIAASVSLLSGYVVDGIVVLANAETIQDQAADTYIGDTIQRQLEHADLLILNKVDLLDPADAEQPDKTIDWLLGHAPNAKVVCSEHARLPPEVILQTFLDRDQGRDFKTDRHDATLFKTITVCIEQPVEAEAIARILAENFSTVVRAKGFVRSPSSQATTIQVVGRRWAVSDAPEDVPFKLVIIGQSHNFDESAIRKAITENSQAAESSQTAEPAQTNQQ